MPTIINGTAILTEILLASGAVQDIVESRIFDSQLPPNTFRVSRDDAPAITIDRVSGARVPVHTEPTTLFTPRYQITCWAWSKNAARELAAVVNELLDSYQGTVQSVDVLIRILDDPPERLEPATGLMQIPLDARLALSVAA
jgi:uncharacterized protein DUF3168